MNVIFVLIAVSLTVAIGFLVSFIWSIRSGQYEDEYTPSVRILFDDEVNVVEEEKTEEGSRQSAVSGQQSAVRNQKPTTNKQPMTNDQ